MAAFLLTLDNIDFVKRALRESLPNVKSSHRIEAFAAAAGYRTHAALLAELRRHEGDRPRVVRVEFSRFVARVADLGYGTMGWDTLIGIVRPPDVPEALWCEFRNGDRTANERWFRACQRRGIPNVYIERRKKYAKLNWDCISIDPSDEAHLRDDQGTALVKEMFRRFQSLARLDSGRSEFFGSAFVGSVDRLLPDIARTLADEIFMLLYAPILVRAAA